MFKNKDSLTKKEQDILKFLADNGATSPKKLAESLSITKQRLFILLPPLLEKDLIIKIGSVPKTLYALNKLVKPLEADFQFFDKNKDFIVEVTSQEIVSAIEKNFYLILPDGQELTGAAAFKFWCGKTKQPIIKTAKEYLETLKKYNKFRDPKLDVIDGSSKIISSFGSHLFLDKMFYLDFYAIERFGKTKTGQKLLYAKKSQNEKLAIEVSQYSKEKILNLAKSLKVEAIAYIPPTEYRKHQFMSTLKRVLSFDLNEIKLIKVITNIAVPQKTLSKIEDRELNARNTIFLEEKDYRYKKVLLIDDAVGSGATFNEVARKMKEKKVAKEVYAVAIAGSFNGFDVINEA